MIRINATEKARLPTNVRPNHYHLTIRPKFRDFTFSGIETVDVQVYERTKKIVLNSLDIAIQSASFVANNEEQPSVKIELNKHDEIAVIKFANELEVGEGQLKLTFTGLINDQPIGFYRIEYETDEWDEIYELVTNFGSANCRRAFPCWDESAIKAKFDLTLVVPKDYFGLSNMKMVKETDDPVHSSKRLFKFATTPSMSTYALAYMIGEYEYIEKRSKSGVLVRIYTATGKVNKLKFALETVIRFLNTYISYPLPKLDLVANRKCYSINWFNRLKSVSQSTWGLIASLNFQTLAVPSDKLRIIQSSVATSVFDSLANQLFGNLVTKDSKHSWINAASSHFISILSKDQLVPETRARETFVVDMLTSALGLDALHHSHPIEINQPDLVLDEISYPKGASLIYMLYHYLGDEAFKRGIESYLSKWADENVITEDLWGSLEEVSQKPVRSFMSAWTQQKGYPLIHVTSQQDGSNRVLTLTQEKFSIDGVLSQEDRQTMWPVPIRIISQGNNEPVEILLENRSQDVILKDVNPNEWVKLNAGLTSFCRVNYPPHMLRLFEPSIVDKSLSSIDRLNILNDLFALVQSGKVSSVSFFELIQTYKLEDQYSVWKTIIECLSKLNRLLDYTDFQELFHLYAQKLLANIYSKVPKEPAISNDKYENERKKDLRNLVRGFLVSCKDPKIEWEANVLFESYVRKNTPRDLRDPIYLAVARDCDENIFESFFNLYFKSSSKRKDLFQYLGTNRDPVKISKLIAFAMSAEVCSEDAIKAFVSIAASNRVGREFVWNYYKENHELFSWKFISDELTCQLVKNLTENFASTEHHQDVLTHFLSHPVACAKRTVQQSLESIKVNAYWLMRDSATIKDYLTSWSELEAAAAT